jgi:hypothetical protein
MPTKQKTYDWGGITLIVDQLKLATKPAQSGSATTISAAELTFLDAITAGTGAVSKALVLDANGDVAMPAAGLITGLARPIIADGTSISVTAAQSGGLIVCDSGAAATFTLPNAVVGLTYDIICPATTDASTFFNCAASDFFEGTIFTLATDTDAVPFESTGDGSADDRLTLNGTTTGGAAGSFLNLTCVTADKWMVSGTLLGSGSLADVFSAP